MKRRWQVGLGAAIVAAGVGAPVAKALAFWNDTVTPFVEGRVTRDDNIFRLSKDLDPATAIGSSSRGDTYSTVAVGVNFDVPVSRQRFQGGLSFNHTRYQRFSNLDFNGRDLRGTWLWQVGNNANGQLGYRESETLASFADLLGTTTPDRLTTREAFVKAAYQLTPRWRVEGDGNAIEQRNSDAARRYNDVDILNGEAALRYTTPANNSVGVSVRAESGDFPNLEPFAGSFIDNTYRQTSAGAVAEWKPTGVSRLTGRIDRVARRYDQISQRDYDGTTFRAEYEWKPTGRLSFTGIAQRDISPYEYLRSRLVIVKGVALRPVYRLTEKIDLSGVVDYNHREYAGDPGPALGLATHRKDRVRTVGLMLTYRPFRAWVVQLNAQHETRSSNVAFGDYTDNLVFASARFSF